MRKPLMAGNWKMNKTVSEAVSFVKALKGAVTGVSNVEILVCPAFTVLYEVNNEIKGSNINLGAQNLFWEAKGAFTGEISTAMIRDTGCSYVIVGHSERRQYFGETDEAVNKKTKAALAADITPIVCVGETLKERENNVTFSVIEKQVRNGLADLTLQQASLTVIAYEPVWAIGTGKTATPDQAQEVHSFIRKIYAQMYEESAEKVRILYGGSVNPGNVSDLMKKSDIDGGLVGGASLEAESFTKLVKYSK
ncbi:triosephosphate isomerase [Endomicrobiia bacterium]|uniref:triose-phosphate isomerase n=1 Tax=Endomicrobium trichonymphae TaxID=1408204 RepID=UPI0008665B39|nr:triosephosphate isomerase [Candidatus Endomicrobium trichonymphae]GHT15622.1 triosephosphate isomerase [Endomicrobiia bacterium]GHT24700.1 triosephosphate isomerase [Endomicrobiia bacterium]GMO53808.1 MAG: triose-phosphate isomerase [Candidatus Endomicrobium trichonymphae]